MGKEVFNVELEKIKNKKVRASTEVILDLLPDYFYEIPASSSGKYHPAFSLGEGGLVRHVKVALRLLEEVFKDSVYGKFSDKKKDLMRMAVMLHDGFKSGKEYSGHTNVDHPVLMHDFIIENQDVLLITPKEAQFVANCILTHMGPWNTDKEGNVIMPVPKTREQKIVHTCDYFASRNFLNVHFENNEIADSANREKTYVMTPRPTETPKE